MKKKAVIIGGDLAGFNLTTGSYTFRFYRGGDGITVDKETVAKYNTMPIANEEYIIDIEFADGRTVKIQVDEKTLNNFLKAVVREHIDEKKLNKRSNYIIIAVIVFIIIGLVSCMTGGESENKSDADKPVATETSQSQTDEATQKKEDNTYHLYDIENVLQKMYDTIAEQRGVGAPKVDVAFSSYRQWESADGIIESDGTYTLSSENGLTHKFRARWGKNSVDLIRLEIDGQRIFWNEDLQTQYMDKYSQNGKTN